MIIGLFLYIGVVHICSQCRVCPTHVYSYTSLFAADASFFLPSGGSALRTHGSVFSVLRDYMSVLFYTCSVHGCNCASSLLWGGRALNFVHIVPPLCTLSPMHLLSADKRYRVVRNTLLTILTLYILTAAAYGSC